MTLQISSKQPTIRSPIVPLPQNNYTTVHTWSINNFSVNLIKNNQNLMFEIIESTKKELINKGSVKITPSITIGRMISRLKSCEVIIKEDNTPRFLPLFHKWNINNQNVSLIWGNEGLIWKIFNTTTNKSFFFNLKETTTIPSKRCHPETVALIEKIKKDSIKNAHILKNDFHVFRVLDIATCRKEHEEWEKIINKLESDYNISLKKYEKTFDNSLKTLIVPGVIGEAVSLFAFWSRIANIAKIYGVAVAAGAGYGALVVGGATTFIPGIIAVVAKYTYDEHKMTKNKNKKEVPLKGEFIKETNRLNGFSIARPLFVEIEPISVESLINPKVRVSKFTWAVTLVAVGGCCKTNVKTHAELLIEGIYDGYFKAKKSEKDSPAYQKKDEVEVNKYFMNLAHLTYEGIESFPLQNPNSFVKSIKERSEIWMKPAKEINQMFNLIQQQKDKETPTNKHFSRFGKESIFTNEHNCITFCLENLKLLNIYPPRNLGDQIADKFVTDPIRYTKNLNYYKDEPITVQI